jgi:hypothetical protein
VTGSGAVGERIPHPTAIPNYLRDTPLVDPTTGRDVYHNGVSQMVEVADPVELETYKLDGVNVSDFVLPSWFAGATTGQATCLGTTCVFPGADLAPANAPGPYDQMGVLTAAWQTIGPDL